MPLETFLHFDWKKHLVRALAFALTVFCNQCSGVYYGDVFRGQTQYLNSADATRGGYGKRSNMGPKPDTESYWHGDDVEGAPKIVISLSQQKVFFYKGGKLVGLSIISSGDDAHRTPSGSFSVLQKDAAHRSSQYGDFVGSEGEIVKPEVDREVDIQPPGSHYVGTMMPHFMRFTGGKGMHAGYLPGYPASHGCVRMPEEMARHFFANATEGTPVDVRP